MDEKNQAKWSKTTSLSRFFNSLPHIWIFSAENPGGADVTPPNFLSRLAGRDGCTDRLFISVGVYQQQHKMVSRAFAPWIIPSKQWETLEIVLKQQYQQLRANCDRFQHTTVNLSRLWSVTIWVNLYPCAGMWCCAVKHVNVFDSFADLQEA